MVYKFVVFNIAIILLATQVHALDTNNDEPILRNEAEKLLHKLEEVLNKALAKAQEELNNAAAKVNKTAASIQGSAVAQMQDMEQKFQQQIDVLKRTAAVAGINIDDCLKGNEEQLVDLPNKLSNDMIHCISDRIIEGISYVQDALKRIQNIVNEVENIKQEIKDCEHGASSAKCLAELALKIEEDITSLPAKITADVAATVILITELDKKIEVCASSKLYECQSTGGKILATIADCVAKKIVTQ